MAEEIHLKSTRASLYLQEGPVRTGRCYGMGAQVSYPEGCGQGDAQDGACYGLRGQDGGRVWRL